MEKSVKTYSKVVEKKFFFLIYIPNLDFLLIKITFTVLSYGQCNVANTKCLIGWGEKIFFWKKKIHFFCSNFLKFKENKIF